MKAKDFSNLPYSLITWLVVIFPLGLSVACATPNFFGGWGLFWQNHAYDFYFLPDIKRHLIGGTLLAAAWIAFFVWFCRKQLRPNATHLPLKLFLLTLVSRGIIALTVGQLITPISDFEFAWNRACTGIVDPKFTSHLLCPTWMVFSALERCWVLLFGPNIGIGLFSGAVFDAITSVMIFYLSTFAFKQRDTAVIASCLYVFYPSSIAFTLTATPEHMGIACFMTMSVMLAKCTTEQTTTRRLLGLAVGSGLIAGLGNSVKPIFILYAIATTICLVAATLRAAGVGKRRLAWSRFAAFLVFVGMEACIFNIAVRCSERMFQMSFRNMDPTPHCLCVGLNRQGEGQIHVGGLSRTWHKLFATGKTPDIVTRMTYDIVIRDWQEHPGDVLPFFMKKFVWTWQDDNRPFGMAMLQLGTKIASRVLDRKDQQIMAKASFERAAGVSWENPNISADSKPSSKASFLDSAWQTIETAGFIVYFAIMLLATAGTIWHNKKQSGVNFTYAWTCLFILGFWGLMVISESASRYKCLVMPYIFIIMAPFATKLIGKTQSNEISATRQQENP